MTAARGARRAGAPGLAGGSAMPLTCLVALDDSAASVDALVWALRHAHGQGMRVEILTVWPPDGSVLIHEVPGHNAARWKARVAQEDAVRRALQEVPGASVAACRLENADAVTAIVRASAHSDLVVLGAGAHEGPHSFTQRVVDGAACEVVVVVAEQRRTSPPGGTRGHRPLDAG